ncbi:MAG TPA: cytochrome c3 family protein [Candidatus Sulfotelmatobacter sp.]|nr:cytochrome c3 family protein [Candidatus Sulfotelmatobacter sp.]
MAVARKLAVAAPILLGFLIVMVAAAGGAEPAQEMCQACHGAPGLTKAGPGGKPISLAVDLNRFGASVHAPLGCSGCHPAAGQVPHPQGMRPVPCETCHAEPGKSYQQSAHGESPRVARNVPCFACHGKHDVAKVQRQTASAMCSGCHGEAYGEHRKSVHGRALAAGDMDAATCTDCHGGHSIRGPRDPASSVYQLNLPRTCARCHADPKLVARHKLPAGDAYRLYMDSIHGRAITRSGLLVAANCSDCHGSHGILPKSDPASKVYRTNIPATCGACHAGILPEYEASIHAQVLKAGVTGAPVCTDCHTAHQIVRPDVTRWKLDVVQECGTCHVPLLETYKDSYHGQVTSLGYARTAKCADCHGAHRILPGSDPRSSVAPGNIVATCQKCHPRANENFAKYDPHANPRTARNPVLRYTFKFMHMLLIGVFIFFVPHTILWFSRALPERLRRGRGPGSPPSGGAAAGVAPPTSPPPPAGTGDPGTEVSRRE